jgi:acetyl esterase/lipase
MEAALRNPSPAASAAPDDLGGWQEIQADIERRAQAACDRAQELCVPHLETRRFGGMDATLIVPRSVEPDRPTVIFLHGGAYVGFSARSSLFASIPLADTLGCRLVALDYPLAPASRFEATVAATAAAITGALEEMGDCYLVGDSAGGGLALAATSQLLARGLPAPKALALISPWTDLSCNGDSHVTLREHDPLLDAEHLAICARTYAGEELQHPLASPLFGVYEANFPPTLILCGSREILLSDALRLHQRLLAAGAETELEVFDGLHHSFPTVTPNTPEAVTARQRIKNYLERYL